MTHPLTDLLATQGWVLADGATGTNFFAAGLEAGEAPEMWNVDAENKVRALYAGAVDAGADLFLTNSFGGNAARLKLHGAEARAAELSRISAEIARDVADRAGRPVIVAGAMGPTGEILEPVGTLSQADAADIFEEQARGLLAGGADILWVETLSATEELAAAAQAIARIGAPWCATMSFDTAGRTMMGVTPQELVAQTTAFIHPPLAVGANCGVGASDLLRSVLSMAGAPLPVIAKGNAGIPKYVHGHIHYDGTPALMADYAALARDCGAAIIGGCCGTTPEHLRHMRRALEIRPRRRAPDPAEIAAALGPFSSETDGTGADPTAKRPRTRRRRRAA
ncbi:MAG: betaine--homocysteine S-methyltransferase [Pseudomonadota bacterium]